jgi:hypothetical protein
MRVPPLLCNVPYCGLGGAMLDAETTALVRKILDEVCAAVSHDEPGARLHVASKLLESASKGETSAEGLKLVGQQALVGAPTMWR